MPAERKGVVSGSGNRGVDSPVADALPGANQSSGVHHVRCAHKMQTEHTSGLHTRRFFFDESSG